MMSAEKHDTHYERYTSGDGPHEEYWKISETEAVSRVLCDYKYSMVSFYDGFAFSNIWL